MNRIHLIITGDVQRVGYRSFVKKEAFALGLTGWVKNRRDGTVEAVCEGKSLALQALIASVHTGPPLARVENVRVVWQNARGQFDSFTVERET